MTVNYTGIAQFGNSVPHVTDEDLRDASVYAGGIIALTDRTKFLLEGGFRESTALKFGEVGPVVNSGAYYVSGSIVLVAATNIVFNSPSARTYTRTIDHPPIYDATHWAQFTDAESVVPVYSSLVIAAGTTNLVWAWRPPSGATVTDVSVLLTPAGSHAGVPAVSIAVAKMLRADISAVNITSQADTSATVVDYETPHELAITGASITFAEGDLLLVRVTPETGANALVSLKVSPPIVTFTRNKLGEE